MNKVAIVAPCHIQPSEAWILALDEARKHEAADIIIVDDSNGKIEFPTKWDVYAYDRQREFLGEERYALFQQFHKSSACKQFGLWRAYELGYEYIIIIDSDCIVPYKFVYLHTKALEGKGNGWENPLKQTKFFSRGFPYSKRNWPIGAHMGLWTNELDLYGTDRIDKYDIPKSPETLVEIYNNLSPAMIPLSGMNVSFRREVVPYMLFLPNFKDKDAVFTRHDDIWGGYIFQKILAKKGYAVSYGKPFVYHDTVVDPEEDAKDEKAMIKYEDDFYYFIDSMLDLRPYMKDASANEIFEYLSHKNNPGHFQGLLEAFTLQSMLYADV